ncbi:DUF6049 family protein [Microbacterium suaedae]|uniref:DUF6049 family protein n=1 Tax=Microbacterium suaedae TaxID=2067813 RepID=UPI000DA1D06A|nr:DUF6049 family protein [Microbacterium suaedae]
MESSTAPPLRGRARRAVALASATAALVAWGALAPSASAAAAPTVAPATVASIDDAEDVDSPLTMVLDSGGVTTDSSLGLTLSVANTSSEEITSSSVTVSIGDPLTDAAAIDRWLDGSSSLAGEEIASFPTEPLPAGASQSLSESLSLDDMPSGVYPIGAEFDAADTPTESRSIVIVPGETTPSVALVVPITGPVWSGGVYPSGALATLTGDDGLLTAQLDAVEGTDAILAVDPAIPAAIRALGDAAPADARAWLERLLGLANDRFALQFADADVSPQIRAGLDAPLPPTGLDAYLDGTEESASLDALLTVDPTTSDDLIWPAPGSADGDVVTALAGDTDARVLVPASSTVDGDTHLGDDVLAYADALSAQLLDAAREGDAVARAQALTAATAEIWLAASEADGPLLLALDRMGSDALTTDAEGATIVDAELSLSSEGLADAVDAAMATPAVTSTSLDGVLSAADGSVSLIDVDADPERRGAVEAYLEDQPALTHISKALESPEVFTGQVRAEILRVLSVGWVTNPQGFAEQSERLSALNDDRAVAIDIQQPAPVQLLSPEAPMPVWIRNDLPYPAHVTIVATPDDPRLSIDRHTEVIAQPDSTTRVSIPIEARVGSGEVTVHYELHARSGELIGPVRAMDVTVRADWERIGIGIFIVLVAGLFGFGIVRQVRRRRRDRADAAKDSTDGMREDDV